MYHIYTYFLGIYVKKNIVAVVVFILLTNYSSFVHLFSFHLLFM